MVSSIPVSSGEEGVVCGLNGGARGFAAPLPLPLRLCDIREDGRRTQLIKGDGKQIIGGNLLMKSL